MTTKTKAQRDEDQLKESRALASAQKERARNPKDEPVGMITANRNSKFKIKAEEAKYVHVYTVNKHVDPDNKEINLEERIIPLWPRVLDQQIANGMFAGYDDAYVIHHPDDKVPSNIKLKPQILGPSGEPVGANADQEKAAKKLHEDIEAAFAEREERLAQREKGMGDMFDAKMRELDEKLALMGQINPNQTAAALAAEPGTTGGKATVAENKAKEEGKGKAEDPKK